MTRRPNARQLSLADGREIILRPAVGRDALAVLAYANALFADAAHWVLTEPEEFVHTLDSEAAFFESLDWGRGDQAWLAWDHDAVVGMLTTEAGRRFKVTHRISLGMGVAASHRGLGIGRALMAVCIDTARAHPRVLKVELDVFADNHRAIGLYEQMGFVAEGVSVKYARRKDGSFVDSLSMGLWLPEPGEPP